MTQLSAQPAHLTSSESSAHGSAVPRLWTRPLRELTPDTSYGFAVIDFARDVLGAPLDPWQEWAVIHGGELLEDGRPRFRKLLILVARQNGKTHLLVVLTLFWLFVDQVAMILGTSTKLDYAKESWLKAVALAKATPELLALLPRTRNRGVRQANGETELTTAEGCRYKIAPANEEGGRSLSIGRVILDELRQHHTYGAWDAIVPATNAVWDAQVIGISNMGDDRSVVLEDVRKDALHFIDTGEGDPRLGLFEWSAPPGASPLDLVALGQANPNMGRRLDPDALLADAASAVRAGGDKLTGFRTEIMCQKVAQLDPAIDPDAWARCSDPGDLASVRSRVALVLDVSLDGAHATLVAAAQLDDGRVRVEVVEAWSGPTAGRDAVDALPGHVARVRPRAFGWLPSGPAAELAADLKDRDEPTAPWPPRGVTVAELRGEVTALCMGYAALVKAGQVAHSDDPLLDAQTATAERVWVQDAWRFTRKGAGHCDAVYAAAGAVHLARTQPRGAGRVRVLVARRQGDTPTA